MIGSTPRKTAEIMVVDDTREDLSLLTALLKSHGYHVRPSDSGDLALQSLQYRKPDLLLLDVRLPGMSGFEVCKRMKSDPNTSDIPVIFITALGETKDKIMGFESGGMDFITKPYQEEEVLLRVRNQLEMHFLRKELEERNTSLYSERELFRTTLMSIGDGVICTDENCRITMMNDVARNMTGWYEDSAIGQSFQAVFRIINEQTREPAQDPLKKVLETGKAFGLANHTVLISKDGIERPIADSAAPIKNTSGRAVGVILVFRDITKEKIHMDAIEFLSFHDHLTELYNRRFLEAELSRLDTLRRLPITLVMGDLNGLKITNDAFGHFAGDELLRNTAEILKSCFRSDDIISRYGGDEFVILLPNTTSKDAESIVNRALEAIRSNKSDKGILSVSFGWAT